VIEEYRIDLKVMCLKKISISNYKSFGTLSHKTRIIELRLIKGKSSLLDARKMLVFLVCVPLEPPARPFK